MTTRIATEKVLEVIENAGLTVTEKKSWLRCEANKDRRLYVPKGAKTIGRIDLSGFTVPEGDEELYGVKSLGDKSFGGVKSQLLFEGTEEAVLANLASVIEFMKSLPGVVKVVKTKAAAETPATEAEASTEHTAHMPLLETGVEVFVTADEE